MDSAKGPYTEQHNPPFRTGIVHSLEGVAPYRVRVQFPDRDNIISWWLPVLVPKIQDDKFFWQPDLGEQVCVVMDEHDENGAVIGSVPSQADFAPSGLGPNIFYIGFKDGTSIQYNRTTHALTITLAAAASLTMTQPAGGKIELDSSGNLILQAATTITLAGAGGALTDALPLVSLLVAAFNSHTHGTIPGAPVTVPWTPSTVASPLFVTET